MNKIVEKAYEINKKAGGFNIEIPDLEIGDIVRLGDVWDGNGTNPVEYLDEDGLASYSYIIADDEWINYVFEPLEINEDESLDTKVTIKEIELI